MSHSEVPAKSFQRSVSVDVLRGLDLSPSHFLGIGAMSPEYLADIPGIRFFSEPANCQSNYWLNALLLDEECAGQMDALLETTNDAGIMTRPAWTLMNKLPMFTGCSRMDLSVAESLGKRLINIPSSASL